MEVSTTNVCDDIQTVNVFDEDKIKHEIINDYNQAIKLAESAKRDTINALQSAMRTGRKLCLLKEHIGQGALKQWLSQPDVNLKRATCWRFMSLSRNVSVLRQIESKSQAYKMLGLIEGKKVNVEAVGTAEVFVWPSFLECFKHVTGKVSKLMGTLKLDQANDEQRQALKEELKPIVELYQGL